MQVLKSILVYLLVPAMFYPVYLIIAKIIDIAAGIQYVLYWNEFESKTQLLRTVIGDWLAALPVMYGIFYLLILPTAHVISKAASGNPWLWFSCGLFIITLLSYLLGFRGMEIVTHSITMAVCMIIYGAANRNLANARLR